MVHLDRVREIDLCLSYFQFERLVSAMFEPFPALIRLKLEPNLVKFPMHPIIVLQIPDGFLGGSARRLQSLELYAISFPALPKFLLSATDLRLIYLTLWDPPQSGYISPDTLVTCLAVLSNLKSLTIQFQTFFISGPDRERYPPPPSRILLPSLTHFTFGGPDEYLEDLLAYIDAPLLDSIRIAFFHKFIFDIPQVCQFMRRTTLFQAFNEAHVEFYLHGITVQSSWIFDGEPGFGISCEVSERTELEFSSVARALTSLFPSIYMVEHLYLYQRAHSPSRWKDDIEDMQYLEIFRPFIAVKDLYLHKEIAQWIAPALQEFVGERVTHVLPALEMIFLKELEPSGPVEKAIGQFVASRQLSGHPVTVSHWD